MADIKLNSTRLQERLQLACLKSGREPSGIKLMLVTKTVPADRILEALQNGYTHVGENKVQEMMSKLPALPREKFRLHFIGHLQTNKVKDVARNCDEVQSIDRIEIAVKLDRELQKLNRKMDVLIQVNTSGEVSKFGIAPAQAVSFITHVSQLKNLSVKGLMTIGIFSSDHDKVRACFKKLKEVQNDISAMNLDGVSMHILSMGMSSDWEIALEEGSTMLRIGTAIFGERPYPDSYYWNEGAR